MTRQERYCIAWYLEHYKYIMDEIANFEITNKGVGNKSAINNPVEGAIIAKYNDQRIDNYCRWEKVIETTINHFKTYNWEQMLIHMFVVQEWQYNGVKNYFKQFCKSERTFYEAFKNIAEFVYEDAKKRECKFFTFTKISDRKRDKRK